MDEDEQLGAPHDLDTGTLGEPAEGEEEAEAPKAKRSIVKPLVIGLVSLLLVAGIAVGALFFLQVGPFAPPPPPPAAAIPMPGPHGPGKPGSVVARGPGAKAAPGAPGKPGVPPKNTPPPKPAKVAVKPPPKPAPVQMADAAPQGGQPASVLKLGLPKKPRGDPFTPYMNLALLHPPVVAPPALPPVTMGGATDSSTSGATDTGLPPVALPPANPAPLTSPWHVAGIMTGDNISAIVVNGDKSAVVQPGDTLPDASASVVSITPTQVTLRTTGGTPTEIQLAVTAAPDTSSTTTPNGGGVQ